VREVSPFDAYRFGMVKMESDGRISVFEEKPRRTRSTLASMGIYVFKRDVLVNWLTKEGKDQVDFGREVMPSLVKRRRVFAFGYDGYWVDIGTVQAYWEANMALLAETPALELDDPRWVIHTRSEERPPAWIGPAANVDGNLLTDGCRIEGRVVRSVISPGVVVAPGALVRDSIILTDTVISEGATVDRAIIDKKVVVGENAQVGVGEENTPNRREPSRINTGLTLIGKGSHIPANARIGRNCVIGVRRTHKDFADLVVPSGETI
jgi:glucose-1-phosphate adenylyltransferase